MSALTRDARWRTAILALRATHSTKAFDESVEAGEADRREEVEAGEADRREEVEAVEADRSEEERSEEVESDRSEEDTRAEGAFPKRSEGSIFLFFWEFFWRDKKRILTVFQDSYY